MTTPAIRAALKQLADAVDGWEIEPAADDPLAVAMDHAHKLLHGLTEGEVLDGAVAAASAALADCGRAVGEGPSAADLLPANPPNIPTTMAMQYRSAWREGVEDGWEEARAILARWGRPTAPPAPEVGEVGEVVAYLQDHGTWLIQSGYANASIDTRDLGIRVFRAALKQLADAVDGLEMDLVVEIAMDHAHKLLRAADESERLSSGRLVSERLDELLTEVEQRDLEPIEIILGSRAFQLYCNERHVYAPGGRLHGGYHGLPVTKSDSEAAEYVAIECQQ